MQHFCLFPCPNQSLLQIKRTCKSTVFTPINIRPTTHTHETNLGMCLKQERGRLQKIRVVLDRVKASYHADQFLVLSYSPLCSQPFPKLTVRKETLGIDPITDYTHFVV